MSVPAVQLSKASRAARLNERDMLPVIFHLPGTLTPLGLLHMRLSSKSAHCDQQDKLRYYGKTISRTFTLAKSKAGVISQS
ncbi:hypothetical protein PBY51_014276 [Eleginops maclovinus]|uniref:Uncharacterized protein n=1 Tax=Eleginops maclovinus TaxID=56733 RepID=A0AAN7ZYS2_ELEMC|nr:hypothetical protein PBY51_014276 [Eleginops maclovinus]